LPDFRNAFCFDSLKKNGKSYPVEKDQDKLIILI